MSKQFFLKQHENCRKCRFHGEKEQTWILLKYDLSKNFNFKIWSLVSFQIKIRHFLGFLTQILTLPTIFISKCDQTGKFHFKIWRVVKGFGQNLTVCSLFISKSDALCFASVQYLTCCEVFKSNPTGWKMLIFKIRWVVKLYFQNPMRCFSWIQNLTRCTNFIENLTCWKVLFQTLTSCFFSHSQSDAL